MGSRLAFAAMLIGCGADPSTLLDGRGGDARRSVNATEPEPDASMPAPATPGDGVVHDASASPSDDAGTGPHADAATTDASSSDASPVVTAFTGAGPFVATTGPSARMAAHAFAGNTPITNPAKQACLGCHVAGGAAKAFAFAGTAFKDVAGTIPAVGVEVRVRAADGGSLSAYTDEDGNFYQSAPIAFPASVGARNATTSRVMMGMPPEGGCNNAQCHDGNAHPWMTVP
jgi:hypothetical protein